MEVLSLPSPGRIFFNFSSLIRLITAGTMVMDKIQAAMMPNATKSPNTRTGGMSARARDAKPTADVIVVKSIGR